MRVYGLWSDVNIQGKGKGNLQLVEREGRYWITLYEESYQSFGDSLKEEVDIVVDALKENPEAAVGAALTAAASGAVKAVAVALGANRSVMRRTPGFENDSAKEFSKTLAKSRETVSRNRLLLLFEKELSSLTGVSNSGNTVSLLLDEPCRLFFEEPKSGENSCREFVGILESIKEKLESSRIKQGIDWILDANGLLTITGGGKMPDWDWHDGATDTPWYARRASIKRVYISDGFTHIGNHAFEKCENLTYVRIPNSVTSIGYAAFRSCMKLHSIDLPNSVTSIRATAFSFCDTLTNIRIPQGVTKIESWTFEYCRLLNYIIIPNSVTSIESSAFLFCDNLTSIHIPYGVTKIGSSAFEYCKELSSISIPNSVTSIGYSAFEECERLSEIRIPKSVTELCGDVFKKCKKLKKVEMPARFDGPLFKFRFGIPKDIVRFT